MGCVLTFFLLYFIPFYLKKIPVTTHKLDIKIHYWISIYNVKNTNLDPVSHTMQKSL